MANNPIKNETITIPCPRCGGHGTGNWNPDQGICYRCGGRGLVSFNAARYMGALRFLRLKYRRIQEALRAGDPLASADLQYCIKNGLRVRHELEAQGYNVR